MTKTTYIIEDVFKSADDSKKNEILRKTILKMSLDNHESYIKKCE